MGYNDWLGEINRNQNRSDKLRKSGAIIKGTDKPTTNRERQMEFWRANTNLPSPETVDKLTRKMDPYTVNKFLEQLRFNVDTQQRKVIKDFEGENPNTFENDPNAPVSPVFESKNMRDQIRKNDFEPLDKLIDRTKAEGGKVHNALFDELARRTDRFGDALFEEKNNHGFKPYETGTRKAVREELEKHPIGHTDGVKRRTKDEQQAGIDAWAESQKLKAKFKETFGMDHEEFFGKAFPLVRSKEDKDADRREQMKAISEATGVPVDDSYEEARDGLSDLQRRVDLEFKKKFDNEDVWATVHKDSRGKYHAVAATKRADGATYIVDPVKNGEERYTLAREYFEKIENENAVKEVRESAPKTFARLQKDLRSNDPDRVRKAKRSLVNTLDLSPEAGGLPGGFTSEQNKDTRLEFLKGITEEEYLKAAEKHARFKIKRDVTAAVILEPFDRTLSTMAQTAEAWSKLDDDNREKNRKGWSPIEQEDLGLTSFDDFVENPLSGIKSMFGGAKRGLLNNNAGEGWVHGNDSLSFKDVLRHNAERNPDSTIGDNRAFQTGVGFAADMVLDPANLLGAGLVTKPLAVARKLPFAKVEKLENVVGEAGRAAAETLAKTNIPKAVLDRHKVDLEGMDLSKGDYLTADDILALSGGNVPKRFASFSEKEAVRKRAQGTLNALQEHSRRVEGPESKLVQQEMREIEKLAARVKAHNEAIVADEVTSVVTDEFKRGLDKAVSNGTMPESLVEEVANKVSHTRLLDALTAHSLNRQGVEGALPFSQHIGRELDHPAFKEVDLDEHIDKLHFGLINSDPEYARLYGNEGKGKALNAEYKALKEEFEANPSPSARKRMTAAKSRVEQHYDGQREAQAAALKSSLSHMVKMKQEDLPYEILDPEKHRALTTLKQRAIEAESGGFGRRDTQGTGAQDRSGKSVYDGDDVPIELDLEGLTLANIDQYLDPETMGVPSESLFEALMGRSANAKGSGEWVRNADGDMVKDLGERKGLIDRAIEKNTSPVGDLKSWDKLETPEFWDEVDLFNEVKNVTADDLFDSDFIGYNPDKQRVFFSSEGFERVFRRPPTPDEKSWINQVAAEANVRGKKIAGERLDRDTALRQRRREIQQGTEAAILENRIETILKGPKSAREHRSAQLYQITHRFRDENGNRVMGVKVRGKDLLWSSHLPTLKKNFEKAGVKVHADTITKSEKLTGALKSLQGARGRKDYDKLFDALVPSNGAEFKSWARSLMDAGVPVSLDRDMMKNLLWHKIQTTDGNRELFPQARLAPEHLFFDQLLKEQTKPLVQKTLGGDANYGMSVARAEKTEKFLTGSGVLAQADMGQFAQKNFKQGITEAEWYMQATTSPESLRTVLLDSPMRSIKFKGKSLDSVLKNADDKIAATKEFADEFYAFMKADPDAGFRAIRDAWKNKLTSKTQNESYSAQKKRQSLSPEYSKARSRVADKVDAKYVPQERDNLLKEAHADAFKEAVELAGQSKLMAKTDFSFPASVATRMDAAKEIRRSTKAIEQVIKEKESLLKEWQGRFRMDVPEWLEPRAQKPTFKGGARPRIETSTPVDEIMVGDTQVKGLEGYRGQQGSALDQKALEVEIQTLREYHASLKKQLVETKAKASKVRDAQLSVLHEESVKKIVDRAVAKRKYGLEVRIGKTFFIPFPEGNAQIRKARDAQNSELMTDLFFKDYRRMFQENIEQGFMEKNFFTKKSGFDPEAQLWMFRATNNTNQVIRYNLDRLKDTVGRYTEKDRIHAYRSMRLSGVRPSEAVQQGLLEEFDGLVKYFNGSYKIHGVPLQMGDLGRWMPAEFALTREGKDMLMTARNGRDVLNAFRDHLSKNAVQKAKANKINQEDPIHVLWKTRVAIENAIADKTLKMSIKTTWGMPLPRRLPGKIPSPMEKQAIDAVRSLRKKGWREVPRLSSDPNFAEMGYIFPPELAKEINVMLDMLEPTNLDHIGGFIDSVVGEFNLKYTDATEDWKFRKQVRDDPEMQATIGGDTQQIMESFLSGFDKTTGAWKTGATIYNPGYYVRNLVGEVMTGYLGGVRNPRMYTRAWGVMRLMNGDDIQDALLSHEPWAQHLGAREANPKRFFMEVGGVKITDEDLVVLYHDQGLKTGFINTQRDTDLGIGKEASSLGLAVGRSAVGKAHGKVREMGEFAEDLPRMAHFMHAMKNAPKSMKTVEARAAYAAGEVRKYHFDYSDVSRFEQTVMSRTFPFFKWTRKALPLLTQSYFLKPGKIASVPKAMDALSEFQTDHALTDEDNGNMPHYTGMVPGWIRDIGAYNIGTDSEGKDTFFNIQVPQMDAIKALTDPSGLGHTLLNPAFKVPMEQLMGHTGGKIEMPVETGQERISNLMRTTPQGSLIDKIINREDGAILEPGDAPLDETIVSFLTGLGLYENDSVVTRYDVERNPVPQNYDVTRPPGIVGE